MSESPADGMGAVCLVMLAMSIAGVRWSMINVTAMVFFEARGIDWHFLASKWNAFAHPDYPLLLPLNYACMALANGEWSDRWIGIHSAAVALALLPIVRDEEARETRPWKAVAITLATAAFALSPQIGLADGALIAFGGPALLTIRRGELRHGAILLGFAAATKSEGMHHLPTDLVAPGLFDRLSARLPALPHIAALMLETLSDPMAWALLAPSLLIIPLRILRTETFVLLTALVQFSGYTIAYLVTPRDPDWHILTSFGRISTHIGAPTAFVITSMLARTAAK